jgi:hypothetical protein
VKEERNILSTANRRKANRIIHILCRNCLLKRVIEGRIDGEHKWREYEKEEVSSYWMTFRKTEGTRN